MSSFSVFVCCHILFVLLLLSCILFWFVAVFQEFICHYFLEFLLNVEKETNLRAKVKCTHYSWMLLLLLLCCVQFQYNFICIPFRIFCFCCFFFFAIFFFLSLCTFISQRGCPSDNNDDSCHHVKVSIVVTVFWWFNV